MVSINSGILDHSMRTAIHYNRSAIVIELNTTTVCVPGYMTYLAEKFVAPEFEKTVLQANSGLITQRTVWS